MTFNEVSNKRKQIYLEKYDLNILWKFLINSLKFFEFFNQWKTFTVFSNFKFNQLKSNRRFRATSIVRKFLFANSLAPCF